MAQESKGGDLGCAGFLVILTFLIGLWGLNQINSEGECGGESMQSGSTCSTTVNGHITSRDADEQASEDHRFGWIVLGGAGVLGVCAILAIANVVSNYRD
ncbi:MULTISPECIES: hypothetical protein [Streptomyces]|uniref:hypothetical protein n=1 Tax=Streptomyces TaxID=1883 RepID=UPI0031EF9193